MKDREALDSIWASLWRVPSGRWPHVRWGFALLAPIAAILWAVSSMIAPDDPDLLTIRTVSQVTGEGMAGASVSVGETRYVANDADEILIEAVPTGTQVVVSAFGHETMARDIADTWSGIETVSLNGILVFGGVTDALSGVSIEGVKLTVVDGIGTPVVATRTDEAGAFVFKMIPEDAHLVSSHEIYGESRHSIDANRSLPVTLGPPVSGRVVDEDGQPIGGVDISGPQIRVSSGPDGRFTLDAIGQGSEITLEAEGIGRAMVSIEGTELGDIVVSADAATPPARTVGGS